MACRVAGVARAVHIGPARVERADCGVDTSASGQPYGLAVTGPQFSSL